MKLYVVRHGETTQNQLGLVQGNTESDLSERGIREAKELNSLVKDLDIDVVVASPLRRAKDTARLITNDKFDIIIEYFIIFFKTL